MHCTKIFCISNGGMNIFTLTIQNPRQTTDGIMILKKLGNSAERVA